MSTYIQGKDGKFAGSVGAGKDGVPTVSDVPTPTGSGATAAEAPTRYINEAYAAYLKHKGTTDRELAPWAADAPFPLVNAIWEADQVTYVDVAYEDVDFDRGGGRTRTGTVAKETVSTILRAEPVKEYPDPGHAPSTITIYRCPAFRADDGTYLGVRARRDRASASMQVGTVTEHGEFTPDTREASFLSEHLGESGCPVHKHSESLVEDWTYKIQGDGTKAGVGGVLINAVMEDREIDPADLVDWGPYDD